jgi:mannonate dehydratase
MMSNKPRREFIKKGAAAAGLLLSPSIGNSHLQPSLSANRELAAYTKDGGMQFSLAYFAGPEPNRVALAKQIGVYGAVGGINNRMANMENRNPWEYEVVMAVKKAWAEMGLDFNVVEGPPTLGTLTKLGLEGRDKEIENFISLMKNLSRAGTQIICYNWMPLISWARTTMDRPSRGGALVSAFDIEDIQKQPDITEYGSITHDKMWENLEYFLKAVIPEAEKVGMKLALHPDDPPIDGIRAIPRIMTSVDAFKRLLDIYPSPSNGLTFCQGSFASMGDPGQDVNIPEAIRYFGKRESIHFVHFRDVRGNKNHFEETFHDDGKTDMYEAMKAYYEIGYKGPIRPDHVPTMHGDSNQRPGYSTWGVLFAIGYMRGLIESVAKQG